MKSAAGLAIFVGVLALAGAAFYGLAGSRGKDTAVSAVTTEAPLVFTGLHAATSQPFFLAAGSYKALWSAWGERTDDPPCTHSAAVVPVDPANDATAFFLVQRVEVPATGASAEVDMLNVVAGNRYLQVTSACAWQVQISRVGD